MNTRNILLAGASAIALGFGLPGSASAQGNFVFGSASGTVSATTAQGHTDGAITSLSSQINSALQQQAVVESNSATTLTGTTVSGGPSQTSSNIMSATAVANQFSNGSGATYVIDPSGIPAGGHAVIGTSQLNQNDADTTTLARLGSAGAVTASAPAGSWVLGTNVTVNFTVTDGAAAGTNDRWTVTGVTGTVDGFTNGQTYTYNSTANTLTRDSDSVVIALGSGTTTTSTGANAQIIAGAYSFPGGGSASLTYGPQTRTASTAGGTTGATSNEISFTAGATYGAPVAVNGNTLAARTNGNLALSSISGGLPLAAIATGPASLLISGLNTDGAAGPASPVAPTVVGANITANAPISITNVQQNIAMDSTSTNPTATAMTASVTNSLVSALFSSATGTVGYSNGTVTASGNAITASATGNSGTIGIALDGTSLSTFSGGAMALTAQGNTVQDGSELAVTATNTNSTLRVQALDSVGLQQISNANAALSSNTVSSAVALNELTSQSLTTTGTLRAQGGNGANGSTVAFVVNPQDSGSSTTTATATADYVNVSLQSNVVDTNLGGTVTGSATTRNAVIGFFGGVANGQVDLQANAVTASTQGNNASLTTVLPWADATAHNTTVALQNNIEVGLTGTVDATQIRISDNSRLATSLSSVQFSSVATATAGSTFTNANLTIGSATSPALGNTVRSTVFGNNATASASIGQAALGGATLSTSAINLDNDRFLDVAADLVSITAPTLVAVGQQNTSTDVTASVTHPAQGTGNYLFQIDAFQGLENGIATIGNNVLRATAAGNVGTAGATVYGAAGNTLGGGVAVATVQGNLNSNVSALLGGGNLVGPTAVIGVDVLENATAQVVNNTFAAVAVGNSATSTLTLPVGTIAGGSSSDTTASITTASNSADTRVTANYAVANSQNNVGSVALATTMNAADSATFASTGPLGGTYTTNGYLPNRLSVGATTFSNATGTVADNTISTTAVGNEFYGTVNGFVAPAASASGTYTSLAMGNTQVNNTLLGQDSAALSANTGNQFLVSSTGTAANAIAGVVGPAGALVDNSILTVSGNTASAGATLNSATMTASGIAISGSDSDGQVASLRSRADAGSLDNSGSSTGPVVLGNTQVNRFGDNTVGTLAGAGAYTGNQSFMANWTASVPTTSSQFSVDGNTASSSAIGNSANMAASLAAGPAFTGGVGLNSSQINAGVNTGGSSYTPIIAWTTQAEFLAGYEDWNGTSANYSSNSTVSVADNAMTAAATMNTAQLSVTAPAGVIIQGNYTSTVLSPTVSPFTGAYGNGRAEANLQAAIAVANTQHSADMSGSAIVTNGLFAANAAATDGTVSVIRNTASANARGNAATISLPVSRLDTTLQSGSAQLFESATLSGSASFLTFQALSGIATVNSTVSVSGNAVTAAATANSLTANVTGLGQSGAPSAAASVLFAESDSDVETGRSGGDVAMLNSQAVVGGNVTANASNVLFEVALANLTASTGTNTSVLSVDSNAVLASVNGNVSTQSILANGPGAATSRGGFGISNAQGVQSSTLTATATNVDINITNDGALAGTTYQATSSPVSVSGNSVGSTAAANTSTLALGFGSMLRAAGTGGNASQSNAGSVSNSTADYVLLNSQATSGATVAATSTNVNVGYFGTANGAPVNVRNNVVYASAFGNSTSMAMTAPLAGGSMQSTNYQSNNGGSVNASISGVTMTAAMSSGASVNAPINVTGNAIRAVSVGNSASSTIGR